MTRSSAGLDLSCKNGTVIITLGRNVNYNETSKTFRVVAKHQGSDQQAVWYIVVVLLFYSIGIIIGIVTYLKREQREVEEEKSYEDYFNFKLDPGRHSRQHRVKHVAMQLKLMEEERLRRSRNPLETDRPRRSSKKRYARSHSWHFGAFSPFTSPVRSSPPNDSSIAQQLRLTLPASLGLPGLPLRQAVSMNVTPTSPCAATPFLPTNKNEGIIRRSLSLNVSADSPTFRLDATAPMRSHPGISIDSPSSTNAARRAESSISHFETLSLLEDEEKTAIVYEIPSPEFRRILVTNL